MPDAAPTPIPAATLIAMRERAAGAPELLMVERAQTMAFAAGACVFPGGRIDPADHVLAATIADGADDHAARVAAIRETIEEAGIAIGLSPLPSVAMLARLRQALNAGQPFGEALRHTGLALDPDALLAFARWCPNHATPRIFDTRFYLARLPEGAPDPVVDGTENARVFWITAADSLAEADAGRMHLIFPTRRTLERLATFDSYAAAAADAKTHVPLVTITPWQELREGVPWLCIPEGLGYPVTAVPARGTRRG